MAEEDKPSHEHDGEEAISIAKEATDAVSTPPPSSPIDDVSSFEPKARTRSPKEDEILDACRQRDLGALEALALSPGGLLTDELRKHAWPILLGLPPIIGIGEDVEKFPHINLDREDASWKDLPRHKDEDQVKLDVDRAFVYYPEYKSDDERSQGKEALSRLILSVLRRHPYLHYFQGYHDIAQVFLLVLPPALRSPAVARLSALRIRDFMLPNMQAAIAQLHLIPAIIHAADPVLWTHLSQTEPFFALSGTLTMYAHDVRSLGEIARLFDALLAREPIFSVYLFARIVLGRRAELFDVAPAEEPDVLHSVLSKLPQPLDVDALVAGAAELRARHPPESLGAAWRRNICPHSVLKTAPSAAACAAQSEAVGEYFFDQHMVELERVERRKRLLRAAWSYRRPAGAIGFAVLFGVLAYWLRRSGASGGSLSGFGGAMDSLRRCLYGTLPSWLYRVL